MSVIWTPLRLVMEENERKEMQSSNLESSNFRHEKKFTTYNSVQSTFKREKGAGDCCDTMRDMDTLPLRTEILRARFQQGIDDEKKLTTTALVERPPNWNKEEFEKRKRHIEERTFDTPDDAGAPNEHRFPNNRSLIGSDSKDRPLVVRMPESYKKDNTTERSEESLNIEKISTKEVALQDEKDDQKSVEVDTIDQHEEEPENDDCIVNCLYYTQQFCDCSIL